MFSFILIDRKLYQQLLQNEWPHLSNLFFLVGKNKSEQIGHSSCLLIIKESLFILFSLEIKSLSISFQLSSLIISFIKISFDLI